MAHESDDTNDQETVEAENPQLQEHGAEMAQRELLDKQLRNGANWFFWIAGLSIANTVILLMEGDRQFVVGLGITQVMNGIAIAIAQQNPEAATISKAAALIVTLVASAVVATFAFGARRGMGWVFILGMSLYFLDGLLLALFQDWPSVGFHLFALWGIFGGLRASRQLSGLESVAVVEAD